MSPRIEKPGSADPDALETGAGKPSSLDPRIARYEQGFEGASARARIAFGAVMWQLARGAAPGAAPSSVARVAKTSFPAGTPGDELLQALSGCGAVATGIDEDGNPAWALASPSLFSEWPRLREWIQMNAALLKTRELAGEKAAIWMAHNGQVEYLMPAGPELDSFRELHESMGARLHQVETAFIQASLAEADRLDSLRWGYRARKITKATMRLVRAHPAKFLLAILIAICMQISSMLPDGIFVNFFHQLTKDFTAPDLRPPPNLGDFMKAAKSGPSKSAKPTPTTTAGKGAAESKNKPGLNILSKLGKGAGDPKRADELEAITDTLLTDLTEQPPRDKSKAPSPVTTSSTSTVPPVTRGVSATSRPPTPRTTPPRPAEDVTLGALKLLEVALKSKSEPSGVARRQLWQSLSMGMDQGTVGTQKSFVECAAFNPNDASIVTGDREGWVRVFSNAPGSEPVDLQQTKPDLGQISVLCVAPDGTFAAVGQGGGFRLFDAHGEPKGKSWTPPESASKPNPEASAGICCAALSDDSTWLAVASSAGALRVSRTADGTDSTPLTAGSRPIVSLALRSDGAFLACGSEGGRVELWDVKRKALTSAVQIGSSVLALTFAADGERLVAAGADGSVKSWKCRTPRDKPHLSGGKSPIRWASFTGPASTLYAVDEQGLRITDLEGRPVQGTVALPAPPSRPLAISRDGRWLLTAATDGAAHLIAIEGPSIPATELKPGSAVRAVAFHPSGDRVATAQDDLTLQVWDLIGQRVGPPLRGPKAPVDRVAFTASGTSVLAISEREMKVFSWSLASSRVVSVSCDFERTTTPTRALPLEGRLRLARSGKYVATCLAAPGPRVWDIRGNSICGMKVNGSPKVVSLEFDLASLRLATSGAEGVPKVWSLAGQQLLEGPAFRPPPTALAWNVAGTRLALGGFGGVAVWDLGTSKLSGPWGAGPTPVDAVAFHPLEPLLATRGRNGETLLRSLDGEIAAPAVESAGSGAATATAAEPLSAAIAFSPDGRLLAYVTTRGTVRFWRSSLQDGLRVASSRLLRSRRPGVATSPAAAAARAWAGAPSTRAGGW